MLKFSRASTYAIGLLACLLAGPLLVVTGEWWRLIRALFISVSSWIFRPSGGRMTLENAVATVGSGCPSGQSLTWCCCRWDRVKVPHWTTAGVQTLFPKLLSWVPSLARAANSQKRRFAGTTLEAMRS